MDEFGRACCIVRAPQTPAALRLHVPHKEHEDDSGSWESERWEVEGALSPFPFWSSHPRESPVTCQVIVCLRDRGSFPSSYLFPCSIAPSFPQTHQVGSQWGPCTSCFLCQGCISHTPVGYFLTSSRFFLKYHPLPPPCHSRTHPLPVTIPDTTCPAFLFISIALTTFGYTNIYFFIMIFVYVFLPQPGGKFL